MWPFRRVKLQEFGGNKETAAPDSTKDGVKHLEAESVRKTKEMNNKIQEMEAVIPVVPNVEAPSGAEVGKHVASGHANFQSWCPDCKKGLAMRQPHRTKKKEQYSRTTTEKSMWLKQKRPKVDGRNPASITW